MYHSKYIFKSIKGKKLQNFPLHAQGFFPWFFEEMFIEVP